MMWYDWYMHISFVAYIINIIIMLLCCSNKYCELGTYKLGTVHVLRVCN